MLALTRTVSVLCNISIELQCRDPPGLLRDNNLTAVSALARIELVFYLLTIVPQFAGSIPSMSRENGIWSTLKWARYGDTLHLLDATDLLSPWLFGSTWDSRCFPFRPPRGGSFNPPDLSSDGSPLAVGLASLIYYQPESMPFRLAKLAGA
ncbi:hypothetical protein Acr_20g0007650 [Actinidia rufa]|uniref:Uncharacterized protein n=1 Tax=Actinidia rufa TaxID=165716 RepID=A0A7J0GDR7_9ERIC|nr:hypothetical protein Acr_20g0007650 [Actinidia rufa]